MVLIFQHDMLHEGEAISTGKKYIMRRSVIRSKERRFKLLNSFLLRMVISDVVYQRVLSQPMSNEEHQARLLLTQAEHLEDASNAEEAVKLYRKAYRLWPALEKRSEN